MAEVDFFLKLDGIDGESRDQIHKDEIELMSWSWGETQRGTFARGAGGPGKGKVPSVSVQDFHFVMRENKASPKVMQACASGDKIKAAVLTCRKAGTQQQEFLKITLTDVLVSSFQSGGSQGSLIPLDQVSLNFAKIEWEYKEQKQDGTLGGSVIGRWELPKNQPH